MFDHAAAPDETAHARYLRAKETVDDRALHRPTLAAARDAATGRDTLRVFEAGPGLGASLRRLLRWDLPAETTYRGVDSDAESVAATRDRLSDLAAAAGYDVDGRAPATLTDGDRTVDVRFETGDAVDAAPEASADLVLAAAFVDLFDPAAALSALRAALAPGGVAYLPVVFNGVTAFDPPHDADDRVLDAYHATMDAPNRPGGSESGRALLGAVRESDATLAAAGGSDWLVTPPYPADEAYFCHHLVGVVERAVTRAESAAEPNRARVPDAVARTWAADRHAAVADGDLTLLVHNLDVLVRAPE